MFIIDHSWGFLSESGVQSLQNLVRTRKFLFTQIKFTDKNRPELDKAGGWSPSPRLCQWGQYWILKSGSLNLNLSPAHMVLGLDPFPLSLIQCNPRSRSTLISSWVQFTELHNQSPGFLIQVTWESLRHLQVLSHLFSGLNSSHFTESLQEI